METFKAATGEHVRYITEAPSVIKKADPTTLYVGQIVPIEMGNPGSASDSPLYHLIYDSFISIDYDTGEYIGSAFKEWELAPDAKSLTFSIYENITFHDGSNATIDDIFYSLARFNDPTLSRQADRNIFGNIDFDNCEKFDDYNGKLVFFGPSINIIPGLTRCWVLSKNHIESKGEDNAWWDNTMGTGMYRVDSIVQGDRYNLVRTGNYWRGENGNFDKVVIRYYAEAGTMYIDYETGALDIAVYPLVNDVRRVVNGDVQNTICDIYPMMINYNLIFNEEMNPILADINVRRAICLAVDSAIVAKVAFDFMAVPARSLTPRGIVDTWLIEPSPDIDAAKQALAEAGYKPGEVKIVIGSNNQSANILMVETIQAHLLEAGFAAELLIVDPTAHIVNFRNTGTDIYDISIGMLSVPTLNSATMLGGNAYSCGATSFAAPTDPVADELALKARNASSQAEKEAAMIEWQRYLIENYWIYPGVDASAAIIYRDYLTGLRAVVPREVNLEQVRLVG